MSHGASTRQPVYSGNRRIPGLYERTLANGSTVYDVAARLGGKVRRHRLATLAVPSGSAVFTATATTPPGYAV